MNGEPIAVPAGAPALPRAGRGKRLLALAIDYLVFSAATLVLMMPFNPTNGLSAGHILFALVLNALFFMKDITGRSIGKKLLGLRIVDARTGLRPRRFTLVLRDLLLVLGIIEFIAILVTKDHERLGDKLTHSIVVQDPRA